MAFMGLATPYLLLINLLFLLFWAFIGNSRFVLSLFVLLLGYSTIPSYIQTNFKQAKPTKNEIKVTSFNVRVFDLYMWSKEKSTRNQMFDFLKKEDPDVLCLQEFFHTENNNKYDFKTLDTLIQFLSAKNYHAHYTLTLRKTDHWGIITFSKYPIVNKGVVNFQEQSDNVSIFTDIKKDNQIIRIYNAHLASIKLDKHDYKAMQEVNKNDYSKDFSQEINMLSKIKKGFLRRANQADSIQKHINQSPHPIIFCGDFNDTPSSYVYKTIKGKKKDAFMESGNGLGRTYIGDFPSFRIDYILYDQKFTSRKYRTHDVKLSDHHPISTYIQITP
jgi:endonuclease/exonuclease/phosphatase family metal-dependent hydrolase